VQGQPYLPSEQTERLTGMAKTIGSLLQLFIANTTKIITLKSISKARYLLE
jgi:hypothetical protein